MISLCIILRRVYVVPNFKDKKEGFHVSAFKWSRPPTDHAGAPDGCNDAAPWAAAAAAGGYGDGSQ